MEQEGFETELTKDMEDNLYSLRVTDPLRKVNNTTLIDYEMCTQGDYAAAFKAYRQTQSLYEGEVRVMNGSTETVFVKAEGPPQFHQRRGQGGREHPEV